MQVRIEDTIRQIGKWLNLAGLYILAALMLMVTADVTMRFFLNKPIKGSWEISELMLAAIIWFGLAYTFAAKRHIKVELFVSHFSPQVQAVLEAFACLLMLVLFSLILWRGTVQALATYQIGEVTSSLGLPLGPFKMVIPLGALVVCLELLLEMVLNIAQITGKSAHNPGSQVSEESSK